MIRILLASTMLVAAAFAGVASAQEAGYARAKTSWGAPDLEGFWNSTSITSLQRPQGVTNLVVNEKEARTIVNDNPLIIITQQENDNEGKDPNDTSILNDKNADRGYNAYWIDPGNKLATVKGELRTSWIVDPPNGRVPFKSGVGRSGGNGLPETNFDGPETRPLFERCLATETTAGAVAASCWGRQSAPRAGVWKCRCLPEHGHPKCAQPWPWPVSSVVWFAKPP